MSKFRGIYWRGSSIVIPGAYAYVDASKMRPDYLSPANVIAAVGVCEGGEPQAIIETTSLQEALDKLRGGNLARAAELMYDPSSEMPGAGKIYFVRVNSAIQSTAAIASQLNLKSRDYGIHTKNIRYKIETGTTASTKKFTVQHQVDDANESVDDLGLAFTIQYIGSVNNARMSINTTTDVLTIETADTSSYTELVSYDLTNVNYNTVGKLVDALKARADLTVTIAKTCDPTMTSTLLDAVTNQAIKSAAYTATANVGSLYYWIITYSNIIDATLGASPSGTLTNVGWTYLTGGTEGAAVTNQDWTDALELFTTKSDVKIVYVATETEAIHLIAQQHCADMSDVKEAKERILICGGSLNETVDQVTTRAVNLGDANVTLVSPGIKRYNLQTGVLDSLSPAYAAAIVAGMCAGSTPATPLTHKTIKVQGIEKNYTNTELETLLTYGVTPLQYLIEDGIYHIVQAITTYQKDSNTVYRKLMGKRIENYLKQEVRNTAKAYIGQIGDSTTIISLKNAMATKLDNLTRTPTQPGGILTKGIVNGEETPAWKNLTVTYDGLDWVQIRFDAHPVGEIDFITVDASFLPATIQV